MANPPTSVTAEALLSRGVAREQEDFIRDARRVAELAAHIPENPPTAQRAVSGDLTRLSQYVADLLRRAAKIEATIEAVGLMETDTAVGTAALEAAED